MSLFSQYKKSVSALLAAGTVIAGTTVVSAVAGAGVAWANGSGRVDIPGDCLNLRGGPNGNTALLGCVPDGTAVSIEATCTGNAVTSPKWGTSSLWDRVTWQGKRGWLADAYVYTGSSGAVAPTDCSTPGTSSTPPPSSSSGNGRKVGAKDTVNRGYSGQCTWGALDQWHQRTGYYPRLSGNAKSWASSARSNGWTVVDDAQVNSIVVFQPGVQGADRTNGHVGFVTKTQRRSDGLYVTFVEMNGTRGAGNWDTRTVKDVRGMAYILMP